MIRARELCRRSPYRDAAEALRQRAVQLKLENPELRSVDIAQRLGVAEATVRRWCAAARRAAK